MGLRTTLTEMFGIDHPVVLAPMGGVAGGALAAAVSDGGGLGVIGAGTGDLQWLSRECELARAGTTKPWGIGFLSWAIDSAAVDAAIEQTPAAIMLSFGDPAPFTETIHAAGIPLIVQVTDVAEARHALEVGADIVVAQGGEAGVRRSRLCLRLSTSRGRSPCWQPAVSPTVAGWLPHLCSARQEPSSEPGSRPRTKR
jgi:nitronate monooxygenase